MIKGIVCCALDGGIGKKNGLLFNIKADMDYFKSNTVKNICVFGYNTYMSLPKRPLKDRVNIVLWDQATSLDCLEGAITFKDFDALLNCVKILAKQYDVYICGGAMLYKLFLPYYDEVLLTKVYATDPEATAFFDLNTLNKNFTSIDAQIVYKDRETNLEYQFFTFIKKTI